MRVFASCSLDLTRLDQVDQTMASIVSVETQDGLSMQEKVQACLQFDCEHLFSLRRVDSLVADRSIEHSLHVRCSCTSFGDECDFAPNCRVGPDLPTATTSAMMTTTTTTNTAEDGGLSIVPALCAEVQCPSRLHSSLMTRCSRSHTRRHRERQRDATDRRTRQCLHQHQDLCAPGAVARAWR